MLTLMLLIQLVNDTYNIQQLMYRLLFIGYIMINVAHITILTMFEFVSNS